MRMPRPNNLSVQQPLPRWEDFEGVVHDPKLSANYGVAPKKQGTTRIMIITLHTFLGSGILNQTFQIPTTTGRRVKNTLGISQKSYSNLSMHLPPENRVLRYGSKTHALLGGSGPRTGHVSSWPGSTIVYKPMAGPFGFGL